jgi:catechol 2,3-dioxygenase-like lactoylglutathione lyase family enzyme
MAKIGYATVGSNQLEEAKAFYDALLTSAGFEGMYEHPSGGRLYGTAGQIAFGVLGPFDGGEATVGNGTMVAFQLDSQADVDAFHAKALALGGSDEGTPGERAPKLYFSYFRDLDRNKLCAYHIG